MNTYRAKITNKQTGLVLEGKYSDWGDTEFFDFQIDGTRRDNSFSIHDWDVEGVKPSPEDIFDTLDVGTKFYWINERGNRMHRDGLRGDKYFWLKVSKDQMVYTSSDGQVVVPSLRYETPIVFFSRNVINVDTIQVIS